jgi:hypothetical protein
MKKLSLFLLFFSFLIIIGCATYTTENRSRLVQNSLIEPCRGKTLGIYAPEIDREKMRNTLSFGTININYDNENVVNSKVEKVYLMDVEDDYYGQLGIIKENIFKDASLNESLLANYGTDLLAEGAASERDYQVPFSKPFGEDKRGVLSNRIVEGDDYVGEPLPAVFSDVILLGESTESPNIQTDYVMHTRIKVYTEFAEILEPASIASRKEYSVEEGQYYLFLKVGIWFTLENEAGGKVFSSKSKLEYPLPGDEVKGILLPVEKGNREDFNKYRENLDYNEILQYALDEFVPCIYPMFNDYYVNYDVKIR